MEIKNFHENNSNFIHLRLLLYLYISFRNFFETFKFFNLTLPKKIDDKI